MSMDKPWKVVLAFAGIFLAGALAGGMMMLRIDRPPRMPGRMPPPREFVPEMLQRMSRELELTAEQQARIQPILQRTQQDFQELRRDHVRDVTAMMERMHADVSAVLTPAQRVKLEEMRQALQSRADRVRRTFLGDGPPPPPPEEMGGFPPPPQPH